jgi:uncharacterized damage-inducible protein DinB
VAGLRAALRSSLAEVESALGGAEAAALAAPAGWSWPDGGRPTGAELLVHAVAHFREHAGQAALLRDLWLANSREGH